MPLCSLLAYVSLLISLDDFFLNYLDIEGWEDVEWNIAVSTHHPVFQRAYREFVYPTLPDNAKMVFDALNHE